MCKKPICAQFALMTSVMTLWKTKYVATFVETVLEMTDSILDHLGTLVAHATNGVVHNM